MPKTLTLKTFIFVTLLTSIWINISEVFRYFVIVRPETQSLLATVPRVADMNWSIFAIWGVWDTLLTGFVVLIAVLWDSAETSRNRVKAAIASGSLAWTLFILFWVAMANMNLARWAFIPIPIALSWLEMVVGTYLASMLFSRFDRLSTHSNTVLFSDR